DFSFVNVCNPLYYFGVRCITYRPDIDGLRAIAVLGVLFFHAGLGFQGGFVGVDVFFVISGFLITSLILRDLREGTFSFVDFWARRIRRIVPALAVMTLAVIVIGYFVMFPSYYESLAKNVITLVLCVSNVKFWRDTGYFDTASNEKPLLHTWSLSVEEQFYFIIPIALFLVFRLKREKLALPLIILTCVMSFAASVYASVNHPSANFYLLPTRAWELGVGSLLAFAGPIKNPKLREFSSFVGLTLIIGCYFLFPEGVSFPGASALPPVLGAALLIWSGIGHDNLPTINRFITLKPIVGIGLISYSLYLWHWPIFAYQKHLGYSADSEAIQFSLLVISFLPAWLSWKYVETPFRIKRVLQTQRGIIQFGGITVMTLLVFGGLLWKSNGFPQRLLPSYEAQQFYNLSTKRYFGDGDFDLGIKNQSPSFVLWGDSHAMSLAEAFDQEALRKNISGKFYGRSGTIPFLDVTMPTSRKHEENQKIAEKISEIGPSCVFLAARFAYTIEGWTPFEGGNNSRFLAVTSIDPNLYSRENSIFSFRHCLEKTVRYFVKQDIKVVIVKDFPELGFNVEEAIYKSLGGIVVLRKQTRPLTIDYNVRNQVVNSIIDEVAHKFIDCHILDAASPLIDSKGEITFKNDKAFFYMDDDHLNDYGAKTLIGPLISQKFRELGLNKD
ncbi:acyltransferase, partial [Akkermansiaceae bacterium]|nr:acyltransferase [Akkermansiaceae bacterium]